MTTTKKTTGKKKKPVIVEKPYLTGQIMDSDTIKSALGVFGVTIGMMVIFLMIGAVLSFDIVALTVILNVVLLVMAYSVFYAMGLSRGTVAVNQGEIMYDRQKTDRPMTKEELSRCYHPGKGFVIGLIGCIPAFVVCLILALIAHKQSYSYGVLPTWVSSITDQRPELAASLAYYSVNTGLGLEDILRIIMRVMQIPYVSLLGSTNYDSMLMLERVSPLLALIPGISYGIGYMGGVRARTKVHSDIAASKRKRKKKSAAKSSPMMMKKKAPRGPKGPEQLN